jgi:hypothetical protein
VTSVGIAIAAPAGTSIDGDGNIAIPAGRGASIALPAGARLRVPGGTAIAPDGRIVIPAGGSGATVALPSGITLRVAGGASGGAGGAGATVIILDSAAPLGYRVESLGARLIGAETYTDAGSAVIPDSDTPLGYISDGSGADISGAEGSMPFKDVAAGDWFFEDVAFAAAHGLFQGTSADTFSPDLPMSRGMFATVLHRLAGEPGARGANPFSDVGAGAYYAGAAAWAGNLGIAGGIGGGLFAPDAEVSRQDLAVLLLNYAGRAGLELSAARESGSFADAAEISGYAAPAVDALHAAGIVNGRDTSDAGAGGAGKFDPKGNATRAEVAAMLRRFIESAR